MNLNDVERRLRELHREGERTRLSFDISAVGTFSYTVQRIVSGRVHVGCSLICPEDALAEANDSIAHADLIGEYEKHLVKP